MARGVEGKLRRRNEKKEARAADAARILEAKDGISQNDFDHQEDELPTPPENLDNDDHSSSEDEKPAKKTKKIKSRRSAQPPSPPSKPIKTLPLVMLILLTGSTLLPAIIYAGDWFGNMAQKHHIMGSLGHRLGVGSSPKKRVMSFYEKHDPSKIKEVPTILSKHYGDYPVLVKKLERKYQDYGYFLNWEKDEAPMQLAKEKFEETYEYLGKLWMKHAPQVVKTGARNARYNITFLYKKGRRLWRIKVWPVLQPFFGVPEGAAAQKRKDAKATRAKKKGKKNAEFRDD